VSSTSGKFFCSILNDRLMTFTKLENTLHPSIPNRFFTWQ
jgi:hypothetical protein